MISPKTITKIFHFDMKKTFFTKDWGFLHGEISKYHFDFLPRLTVTATPHILEINLGFLSFRLWLSIFSRQMQKFYENNNPSE